MQLRYCSNAEYFIETLGEYIQDKSALHLDNLLNRNLQEWKHAIPNGLISLAVCTQTLRNKVDMNESPVVTLEVLSKWKFDLLENRCNSFRMLLYTLYALDDSDPLLDAMHDIMEYFLVTTSVDIQNLDCRELDEDESLLMVSCQRDVDFSIKTSFDKLNEIRHRKLQILKVFLSNTCALEAPYNDIVAEYVFGGQYQFRFSENDYNPVTGQYWLVL